jgi:hypothetical protein
MMRGLFGEGDPAAQLAEFKRLDRSKPSRRMLRLADGTTVEARVQPMADGGFIECFTDVTAFTGPLETSRQDLRLLEEVFNQLSLGVAVFKQDELLLYNPAYPRLTGLPANQARTGLTATQLNDMQAARGEFTPEQREEWEAHRASRDPGKRSSMERRRPNGTALRLETYPLADETTLYEFSDVTAERRAQEEACWPRCPSASPSMVRTSGCGWSMSPSTTSTPAIISRSATNSKPSCAPAPWPAYSALATQRCTFASS